MPLAALKPTLAARCGAAAERTALRRHCGNICDDAAGSGHRYRPDSRSLQDRQRHSRTGTFVYACPSGICERFTGVQTMSQRRLPLKWSSYLRTIPHYLQAFDPQGLESLFEIVLICIYRCTLCSLKLINVTVGTKGIKNAPSSTFCINRVIQHMDVFHRSGTRCRRGPSQPTG